MKKNKILPTRFSIENTNYDADVLENLSTGKIHWHSHFLISIFIRGTGIQHLNNSEYKFHPGTAVLLGPFDFHYNETEETFDAYSIKFTHKIFNSRLYKECSPDHFPIVTELSERDFNLATTLCKFLIEEKNNPNSFGNEILAEGIIEQLVILILRNCNKTITPPSSDHNIIKALVFIHDNFKENISVKDVADICHYTPNHFSYFFKKELGITFQKYLHSLRLEYAFNMINFGNKSCSEACFESGFNSLEYFSSSFKKKYGVSPKFYIKS